MKTKQYVVFYMDTSGRWVSCGVINARSSAGALAQFAKDIHNISPNITAIRAEEK